MKRLLLVGAVVGTHVVVLGSIFLQGCGTTGGVTAPQPTPPPPPAMPAPVMAPVTTRPVHVPTPAQPVARPVARDTKAYTVQKGDSLSLIAQRYGVSQAEILGVNAIKDSNRLLVGQTIQLPARVNLEAPRPTTTRAAAPAATAAPGAGEYVVQAGDSLSKIAAKYKVSVTALKSANNLQSDRILVGQKLKIPDGAAPAAAASPAPVAPAPAAVTTPAPAASAAPAAESSRSYRTYEVVAGEDLYHVSLMWDVEIADLQRANNLTGTALTPGQTLKIPLPE